MYLCLSPPRAHIGVLSTVLFNRFSFKSAAKNFTNLFLDMSHKVLYLVIFSGIIQGYLFMLFCA